MYEFVGMCDELFPVFGAEVRYFCFNSGICRSVCKIVFGTYRGALIMDPRTLFFKSLQYFDVGITCCIPEGDAVRSDGL